MGADSFPDSDSIGIEVRVKFTEIVLVLKLKKVGDCLIITGRLFQRGTIRLKNESLKREVRKHFGRRFILAEEVDQLPIYLL